MHAQGEAEWLTLMFNYLMPTLQREGLVGALVGALAHERALLEALQETLKIMHS